MACPSKVENFVVQLGKCVEKGKYRDRPKGGQIFPNFNNKQHFYAGKLIFIWKIRRSDISLREISIVNRKIWEIPNFCPSDIVSGKFWTPMKFFPSWKAIFVNFFDSKFFIKVNKQQRAIPSNYQMIRGNKPESNEGEVFKKLDFQTSNSCFSQRLQNSFIPLGRITLIPRRFSTSRPKINNFNFFKQL